MISLSCNAFLLLQEVYTLWQHVRPKHVVELGVLYDFLSGADPRLRLVTVLVPDAYCGFGVFGDDP